MKNMNWMKLIPMIGLLFLGACAGDAQQNVGGETGTDEVAQMTYDDVSVAKFKELMETMPEAQLLDVRTSGECAEGMIDGALAMDIQGADFSRSLESLNKNLPVLVYCKSGGRSGRAMDIMEDLGFTKVFNLNGGITAWREAGESVTTAE